MAGLYWLQKLGFHAFHTPTTGLRARYAVKNLLSRHESDAASISVHHASHDTDPYLNPSFTLRHRVARLLWETVYVLFFKHSPRPLHAWRSFLLRLFGARLGKKCHIYPKARIWAPWNLECGDVVAVADEAIIYNPSLITLESHATISMQAYLCGAGHDHNHPAFPMISSPIRIGAYAWICARATVQMGVMVGEGAVLGLGAVTGRDLDPWSVYGGVPARKIKDRISHNGHQG